MRSALLWACLFPLGLGSCRSPDAALNAALQADLDNYLATRSTVEHISAASLSVSLHGAPSNINVTAGTMEYGGAGGHVTPASLYQIGSITKGETAAILLQLEAEGTLTIHQTVGHWLPQYPAWRTVTIQQLLNMTSGIPTYDDTPAWLTTTGSAPMTVYSPAQLIAFVYPHGTLPTPPASVWLYSNTGYAMAELIIDSATHSDYATQLANRIITPLRLHNTFYHPDVTPPAVASRMVAGYYFNHDTASAGLAPLLGRDVRPFSISWTRAAGGMVATPEDVTTIARALFQGSLLPPVQRQELLSLVSETTGQPITSTTLAERKGFGLGTGQLTLPAPLGTIWYYEGETLGYRMLYAYFPTQDAVIAVGLNSQPDKSEDKIGPLVQTIYTTLHEAGKL
jgi:D-alanyl-D-alanine carboxypeptidase